jgi:hypothetical protein
LGHRQQRQLSLAGAFPAEPVNRLAPGSGGQPAARVRWQPFGAPVLQCLHECVLHQLFCQTNIAEPHSQRRPDPDGLRPVDLLQLAGIVHVG